MGREQAEDREPDDEDWTSFSSSGYGDGGYDPWSDLEPLKTESTDVDDEGDDHLSQVDEISPAPSPSGLRYLVAIGCCNECLGRVGGRTLLGSNTAEAGEDIRAEHGDAAIAAEKAEAAEVCPLCEDLFADIEIMADRLVRGVEGYEVQRLQIGIQLPEDLIESEDHIRKRYGAPGSQPFKATLARSLGDSIKARLPGLALVSERPDVLALVDGLTLDVRLEHRSLFLYTRYRKLERGIPQTRWPCRVCKGRGCERCEQTGLQYPDSVQALIADPLLELFGAEEHATHSMGREDIDVRCLGRGRPTVIELKHPHLRTADLGAATELVNTACGGRVEIEPIRKSDKSEVVRVKNTPAEKTYRIRFTISIPEPEPVQQESQTEQEDEAEEESEVGPTEEEISTAPAELPSEDEIRKTLNGLAGVELAQRTPKRVSHRRADKVRKRSIISVQDIDIDGADIELTLRAQSGTYIKELVGSDGGRTKPSISDLLSVDCEIHWLDVLDIHAD